MRKNVYPDYKVKKISSFKDLIEIMVTEHKDNVAFKFLDKEWTYNEISEKVLILCKSLRKLAYKKIRIDTKDNVRFSISYLATVLIGKVAVLGEQGLSNNDDTLIIDDNNYFSFVIGEPLALKEIEIQNIDDLCTILHSSGTSDSSKRVMLSQKNICTNLVSGLEKYSMKKEDVFLNIIPYYHAFGLVCDLLAPLLVGATICILDDKKLFFSKMVEYRPTILNAPPIIAETLLKLIESTGDSNLITGGRLKKILCGGAGLKGNTSKKLRKYGILSYGCYGLSECSPCVSVNRDDYYKDGSAGVLLNCNKVTIAEDNEILITGTNVMMGYYQDINLTKEVLIDGVLHTGDLGYIDDDGFLFIIGRKTNLIVFADGKKCSPEIIEKMILDNTNVEEALVYMDEKTPELGLNIILYIINNVDKDKILNFISKKITQYKFNNIEFVNEPLPRNDFGKIIRKRK